MARTAKVGWYPDPRTAGDERHWDGKTWGETRLAPPYRPRRARWPWVLGGLVLLMIAIPVLLVLGLAAGTPSGTVMHTSARAVRVCVSPTAPASLDGHFATGHLAVARARATVSHPGRILLSVSAAPAQRVSASWTLACTKGLRSATRNGRRTLRAPARLTLTQPMRRGDACVVTAQARLSGSGRVVVKLTAAKR